MARSRYWRGGWGSLKAPPRPPKLNTRDAMDLRHGDAKEPVPDLPEAIASRDRTR